jgi:hypothetical protein
MATHIVYSFDNAIENTVAFSHHIPKVTPPKKKAETDQCVSSAAPVQWGSFNITPIKP